MTATTLDPARGHGDFREQLREHGAVQACALSLILAFATFNFFWRLGASSLFTDEAFSVIHSLPSFHTMFHVIGHTENTPYTYFLFLHEWMIRTGSQAAWVVRFPSAVAGVALVWAVYWMAAAFMDRTWALCAAGGTAISPLILSYAQEARVYSFLMLAVVVMVGATVRAVQRSDRRMPLLVLGAVVAFVSIWLHYTAVSVVLPLAVWVVTRTKLRRRQRAVFVLGGIAGLLTVLPVLLEQYKYNPNGGAITGNFNLRNVISVAGTPFGSRVGTPIDFSTILAALVVIASVVVLLLSRGERVRERRLLAALGAFGVIALMGVDLLGNHILITRYTAVTAPFLVVVIVAASVELPRTAGVLLATAAAALAVAGVVYNHSRSSLYAPARQAVAYIARRERAGDYLFTPGVPLTDTPIFYYVTRRLHPKLDFVGLNDKGVVKTMFSRRGRIWIIEKVHSPTDAAAIAAVTPLLRSFRYHVAALHVYTTSITLATLLVVPNARSGARAHRISV